MLASCLGLAKAGQDSDFCVGIDIAEASVQYRWQL
jgi:hypothetical protein